MAVAIIEISIGLKDKTTLACELGVGLANGAALVTGLVLTQNTAGLGTYRITTTAALVGLHWVRVYDSVSGAHKGTWYVWMTDEALVHIAVDYPNVIDRLGTMRSETSGTIAVPDVFVTILASAPALITVNEGGKLTIHKGDITTFRLVLGTVAGRSGEKLYFTIKRDKYSDTDSLAVLQVTETSGALVINGEVASVAGDASITVEDENDGTTLFIIKSDLSELLLPEAELWYDVQMIDSSGERVTKTQGRVDINRDVTWSPVDE